MKKFLVSALAATFVLGLASCNKDDDNNTPTPTPTPSNVVIEGEISTDLVLDATKKYILRGKVYVLDGASITIPAGTIVMGEKSTEGTLIINRGGQIFANGTADKPVIFTSEGTVGFRNRGDWGGVVICGRSVTNGNPNSTIEGISGDANSENGKYGPGSGSAILNDNSGVMTYCRIEFAGIDLSQDNELNSLTMGSVGSETEIHHIQVSYANDDAFEWFGGTNDMKYVIAYNTLDDDFDTDRGYSGKVQYGIVLREKATADISTSRAFEASSNNTATVTPHSEPVFANFTVLGPRLYSSTINTLYGACVEINSNTNIKIVNSILAGFPIGVRYNTSGASCLVSGNVFAENATLSAASGGSTVPSDLETVNVGNATKAQIWGANADFSSYPPANIFQDAASPYITGAPSAAAYGVEVQPYYGAYGSSAPAGWDYSAGWINLDPINTVY